MNNNFKIGDSVLINNYIDTPEIEQYLNDHAIILEIWPPYVEVKFLNGETAIVLLNNIKKYPN